MNKIPDITDDRLNELAARIKPVARDPVRNALCYLQPCDLRSRSFLCPADFTSPAALVYLSEIYTLHTYGDRERFAPSVAEVLAQIPAHLVDQTVAFQTRPLCLDDWGSKHPGFHGALTQLYGAKPNPSEAEVLLRALLLAAQRYAATRPDWARFEKAGEIRSFLSHKPPQVICRELVAALHELGCRLETVSPKWHLFRGSEFQFDTTPYLKSEFFKTSSRWFSGVCRAYLKRFRVVGGHELKDK